MIKLINVESHNKIQKLKILQIMKMNIHFLDKIKRYTKNEIAD